MIYYPNQLNGVPMNRFKLYTMAILSLASALSHAGQWKEGKNGEWEWHEEVKGKTDQKNNRIRETSKNKTIPFGLVKPYYFFNFDFSLSNSSEYYLESYKMDLICITRKNSLFSFKLYRIYNTTVDTIDNALNDPKGMAASFLHGLPFAAKRRKHAISLGTIDFGLRMDLNFHDTGTWDDSNHYRGRYAEVKLRTGIRFLYGRYKLFWDNFLFSAYIHAIAKMKRLHGEIETPPGSNAVSNSSTEWSPGITAGFLLQWYSFRFAYELGYCDGQEFKIEFGMGFGL